MKKIELNEMDKKMMLVAFIVFMVIGLPYFSAYLKLGFTILVIAVALGVMLGIAKKIVDKKKTVVNAEYKIITENEK